MLTMTSFRITAPYYFYNSIRPGRVTGDSRVIDIPQLKYTTEISYKLHHTDKEWKHLPQRINLNVHSEHSPVQVNKQPIPLTRSKWNDLQSLKGVIPSDFHSYYDNLPKKIVSNNIIVLYLYNYSIIFLYCK